MRYNSAICLLVILLNKSHVIAQPPPPPQNLQMAQRNVDSIKAVLESIKIDTQKIKPLYDLAFSFGRLLQNAESYNTGRLYYSDSIIKYGNMVLALSDKVKDGRTWKKRTHFMLGNAYRNKNVPEALKNFYTALNLSREANDIQMTGGILNNIGNIFMSNTTNYEEAIKYYLEAYKINKELNIGGSGPLFNIGLVYYGRKQYREALKYYLEGFALDSIGPNKALRATRYGNIGTCYAKLGDHAKAQYYLGVALNLGTEISIKPLIATAHIYLGIDYYNEAALLEREAAERKYQQAFTSLNNGIKLAVASTEKRDAYFVLSKLYERNNDLNKALECAKLYASFQDSLQLRESTSLVEQIRTDYQIEKTRAEEKLNQEKAEAAQKAINDKTLAAQQLQQERLLADQRVINEKNINEQRLEQEKILADVRVANELKTASEKNIYEKSIADEKTKQEKIRSEKRQTNNLLLMGLIFVILSSAFLLLYLRQKQLKKRAVERIEFVHKMAELEMQSLRSQLNPHFMFNSLNSIQTLILKEDSDKSQSYLARFARLLRMLLENAEKPFVPLQKEIDFLQLYLSLENLRVPDLQYAISIDPFLNTEQLLIPNMILQPYVENAIWHGLSYKEADKQLQIRINRSNGIIKYEIEDNGVGRKKSEELKSLFRKQHQSKGMELLNKRFKLLNGEYNSTIETNITDVLKDNEVAGTLVTIKVPVQLSLPLQN